MARSFNGTSDKIVTSSVATTAITNITMAIWVYPTSTPSGTQIVFSNGTNSNGYALLTSHINGALSFVKSGVGFIDFIGFTVSANVWTHFCVTFSTGGNAVLFLNGVSQDTVSAGSGTIAPASSVAFGSDGTDSFYPGRLADGGIWTATLSGGEILALGNGARPGSIRQQNLVGWWPLDGLNSPEPDLSGKANNGTLTGTALAAGPPVMMLTPRWPQTKIAVAAAAAAGIHFRRTLSPLGTRAGSRQAA